jgi:hypothetical protein
LVGSRLHWQRLSAVTNDSFRLTAKSNLTISCSFDEQLQEIVDPAMSNNCVRSEASVQSVAHAGAGQYIGFLQRRVGARDVAVEVPTPW